MNLISNLVARLHQKKAIYFENLIGSFLTKRGKVMDLGCGSGVFTKQLLEGGYDVTAVDVVNKVKVSGVNPIIYDGKKLPFADKEFDQVLLMTVVHHVPHYEDFLKEVGRVTRQIIMVEDVPENNADKFWIQFWDSILNLEFFGHPHNNQSDQEWKGIFRQMGFKLKGEKDGKLKELIYSFKQKAYWLGV